jgi:hypothetical protein
MSRPLIGYASYCSDRQIQRWKPDTSIRPMAGFTSTPSLQCSKDVLDKLSSAQTTAQSLRKWLEINPTLVYT